MTGPMEVIRDILAGLGLLVLVIFVVVMGWAWLAWRREHRPSSKTAPAPEQLSDADCKRLLDDLDAWERGERP